MLDRHTPRREAAEDLFFGQAAILWARWALIAGGALLALGRSASPPELALTISPVLVLLLVNFYLHGRYLVEQPANERLVLLTSVLDLLMVTVMAALWRGPAGIGNPYFVLFYPIVFAFALVFPPRLALAHTATALVLYALFVLLGWPTVLDSARELKVLVERLITLGAMGGLGTYYWRILREQRRRSTAARTRGASAAVAAPAGV